MPSYDYEPLPPDGSVIRLLKLLPGNPQDSIRISISYKPFSPKRALKYDYEALSYAWGSQKNRATIEVQMTESLKRSLSGTGKSQSKSKGDEWKTLEIGRNLASALIHLRKETCHRTLV